MLATTCCDPVYIEFPFRFQHIYESTDSLIYPTNHTMDPNQKSKKSKSFAFWKKTPSKTPRSSNQVRGAQYPPIFGKNPYQDPPPGKSSKRRSNSANLTLKVSSNDNYKNYKHTNYPPLQSKTIEDIPINNSNNANNSNYPAPTPIDMEELIQSAKIEHEQLQEAHRDSLGDHPPTPSDHRQKDELRVDTHFNHSRNNSNHKARSPVANSIDPSAIVDWEEMKTDNEAFARKNRNRINLLSKMLENTVLESTALRRACWRGIPTSMRPQIWKLLLGYTPKNLARRQMTLDKKRKEYYDLVSRYYTDTKKEHRSDQENKIVHQIGLDVPRTSPELRLFQIECINNLLSRALYLWARKHTATGYVQGINDLITPFVYIFLDEYLQTNYDGICLADFDLSREIIKTKLSEKMLVHIEADSYWCLDYLIEGLQLNYTDNQPGIYHMVSQLEDVIKRVNEALYKHFESENVEIFQFSFRWMNCLLMRELSLQNIIRLWDTISVKAWN